MMSSMKFARFTTLEIVLMAILATVNAIVTIFMSTVNQFLTTLGGPIATSTIVGVYMVYGVLAIYIIRKPGAACITYAIGAAIQCLLGNAYGIPAAITAALCYAVAVEGIACCFKYKRWTLPVMLLIGLCAVPLWYIGAVYLFGYTAWSIPQLVIAFIVRCISGIILCGWLSKVLGDTLLKTGMLRAFLIAKAAKLK